MLRYKIILWIYHFLVPCLARFQSSWVLEPPCHPCRGQEVDPAAPPDVVYSRCTRAEYDLAARARIVAVPHAEVAAAEPGEVEHEGCEVDRAREDAIHEHANENLCMQCVRFL